MTYDMIFHMSWIEGELTDPNDLYADNDWTQNQRQWVRGSK